MVGNEVNHFGGIGRKKEKHGAPSRESLAQEVQDVLRCALQVASHYGVRA
jgi:hypothetical protein